MESAAVMEKADVADLTREQILERARAAKIERAALVVPELGGRIWVRGMSGKERDKFEEGMRLRSGPNRGSVDMKNFRARFVVRVVVNKDGAQLFNEMDSDVIGKLPAGVLDRIIAKSTELSAASDEGVEELGND